MSLTTTAGSVAGPRRVRHQALDVVLLMAFSAVSSSAVAGCLLLVGHLSRTGR